VRDAVMAGLVEMGFTPAQAAAYSLRYPSMESAIDALMRDEASGAQNAAGAPAQAPPSASSHAPAEERKEADGDDVMFWRPLQTSLLGGSSSGGSDAIDLTGDTPGQSAPNHASHEFEVLPRSLAHMHLLQHWTTTTLVSALKPDACRGSIAVTSTKGEQQAISGSATPSETVNPLTPLAGETNAGSPVLISSLATPTLTTIMLGDSEEDIAAPSPAAPSLLGDDTPAADSKGALTLTDGSTATDEEDTDCVICYAAVRDCLLLPCKHVALCGACVSDYFSRVREYNAEARLLRVEAEREAQRHPQRNNTARQKHADRDVHCPSCSQTVQIAVRRVPTPVAP